MPAGHFKPVAASQEGIALLQRAGVNGVRHADTSQPVVSEYGVVTAVSNDGSLPADFYEQFASVLAGHRVWERDPAASRPNHTSRMLGDREPFP